jgi:hypothetical protein
MGAMDYLMTQMENESYMAKFTPEQLDYFYSFPIWVTASWALAVWGGVAGGVLLLLRNRFAVHAFLVSLVSMVITTIHNYGISNGLEVVGDAGALAFTAVIFLAAVALYVYARSMQKCGVLR